MAETIKNKFTVDIAWHTPYAIWDRNPYCYAKDLPSDEPPKRFTFTVLSNDDVQIAGFEDNYTLTTQNKLLKTLSGSTANTPPLAKACRTDFRGPSFVQCRIMYEANSDLFNCYYYSGALNKNLTGLQKTIVNRFFAAALLLTDNDE